MSEWNFVGAAYGLTWVIFVGYAIYLSGKVRRAERRLERSQRYSEVE